jgi:hypothetical protein
LALLDQPNAETEPYLAADPHNNRHLVAIWAQDDFTQPAIAESHDGGRSFTEHLLPGLTKCSGGQYEFSTDPWLSFGPRGDLFASAFAGDPLAYPATEPLTEVAIYHSSDGSAGFAKSPVIAQPVDGNFWDKPSITADPRHPGTAYLVDTRRPPGTTNQGGVSFFSKTTDFGSNWTPAQVIYSPGSGLLPTGSVISALAHGVLLHTFALVAGASQEGGLADLKVMSQRSTDGGITWSAPIQLDVWTSQALSDPDHPGETYQTPVLPAVAVDRHGIAYLTWSVVKANSPAQIVVSSSRNGGRFWTLPRAAVTLRRGQAFMPALATARDGTLAVTWYDSRNDVAGDGKFSVDYRFAASADNGRHWSGVRVISPFDLHQAAPLAGPRFIGDYFGLAPVPGGFGSLFIVPGPQNKSDVYFARIEVVTKPRRTHRGH